MFSPKKSILALFLSTLLIFLSTNSLAQRVEIKPAKLTLNAQLQLAEGKKLSDGIVLLTHGTLAHNGMEIITGLQSLLAENEVSTLAINLSLGVDNREGFYDCKVPHQHQHEDAVMEINAWVNWLKSQGVKSITLAGHSRGGNQTAWFASEQNMENIDKVVLIAPMIWSYEAANKEYKKKYNKKVKTVFEQAKAADKAAFLEHTDFIYCKDSQVQATAFISYYKNEPRLDTPYLLNKISKPVLVIAGSEDKVVKGLIKKVEPLADGDKIRLSIIEGAGHMFMDLYLEELVETMLEF